MDGSRACKIGKKFESSGLRDSTKWDVLQGEMVDGMVLLAECITPYLKRLNT